MSVVEKIKEAEGPTSMPRILLIACALLLLFSCKQKSAFSGDHLSRDLMQKVILDVNLAEAYSISAKDSLHKVGTKNVDSLPAFYKRVFDHYKITEAEFNTSLEWYKSHPEELDSVYAHIIPIANKLQAQLPVQKTPPPAAIAATSQGIPMPQTPLHTAAPHSPVMHPNMPKDAPHPAPKRPVDNDKEN